MGVTVFTQPDCLPCKRVIKKMEEAGIEPAVIDISQDKDALHHLAEMGARSTPVIEVEGRDPIMGYDPIKLKELISELSGS